MRRFPVIIVTISFLTACTPTAKVSDAVGSLVKTASGTITEVSSKGMQAVQPVLDTVEDVKARAATVEEGYQKMQEGKKLIEQGLKP